MRSNLEHNQAKKKMLMGLGLDGKDEHKRITKGENFVLLGGSEETHERMTEKVVKLNEKLSKKGKTLDDISNDELMDLMGDS